MPIALLLWVEPCRRATASGHLSVLIPELLRSAAGLAGDDPARARFSLYDALGRGLTIAARRAPLLVVLDDLHWAG